MNLRLYLVNNGHRDIVELRDGEELVAIIDTLVARRGVRIFTTGEMVVDPPITLNAWRVLDSPPPMSVDIYAKETTDGH